MSKRNRRKARAAEVRAERETSESEEVEAAEGSAPHRGSGTGKLEIEYTLSDELDAELGHERGKEAPDDTSGVNPVDGDSDEYSSDDDGRYGEELDELEELVPEGEETPGVRSGASEAQARHEQEREHREQFSDDEDEERYDAADAIGYDPNDYPAVTAVHLGKDYGDVPALYPLDLEVAAGQAVALIGHNGSGKSTFLKMVAGLLEPSSGDVEVAGWGVGTAPARASTSYLPDDPVLYDDLSVREHIEYVSRLHGGEGYDAYAESLLERLGLLDRVDELPSRFSRGLRQKTSIVLGMVRPFSVLLVDEPFVGLDASGRTTMLELLDEVHSDGAAVLVATHEPEFVERVDRCVALRDGRLIFDGQASVKDVLGLVTG